jgi:hypothetical protein
MKAGTYEVADEFKSGFSTSTIAVGAKLENGVWNGATTATKALIAGLTPGAGQFLFSRCINISCKQCKHCLTLSNTMIYNDSQSKTVPGFRRIQKVLFYCSGYKLASIVAEYVKIYNTIPDNFSNDRRRCPACFTSR